MDLLEVVAAQLFSTRHPCCKPLYRELFLGRVKAPAKRGLCLHSDCIAVAKAGIRSNLKFSFIRIFRIAVGNLHLCPAFTGHAGKLDIHRRKWISCARKGELMYRRTGNSQIDQEHSCDYAKSNEHALQTAPALSFHPQILDIFLGTGQRYSPLIFLLRAIIRIDKHFMSAVRAYGLFSVRRQFHFPSARGTNKRQCLDKLLFHIAADLHILSKLFFSLIYSDKSG